MNALRSSFPCSPSSAVASGNNHVTGQKVRVKVLVVGAGPIGLFAMQQLEGLQFYHNERLCTGSNKNSFLARKVLVHDMSPQGHNPNDVKMISGQKFASLYDKKTHSYERCLEWHFDSGQKLDWMMCSDEPVGGSWNTYLPSQQTLSDYREMGLPDYPIEQCDVRKIPLPPPPRPCQRVVTDGESLLKYYQDYGKKILTESRAVPGRVVSATQAGSVWQSGLFWEVIVRGAAGQETQIQCDYLMLAIGKKKPNLLNIPGERDNPHVSHWTHEACRAMDKLAPGSKVLVVGNSYSASDTIYEAWQKGMKVIHLLPAKIKEEALSVKNQPGKWGRHPLIQHLNYKRSKRHYSVAEAMACPEKYQAGYEQGLDCRLVGIEKQRLCHIVQELAGTEEQHFQLEFDHIALLTGVKVDYPFFPDTLKSSLTQSNGYLDLCPETMESNACQNLFCIGFSAGESFLSHSLGHAVAAVETIRKREQDKKTQMMKRDEVVPMEWE